MKYKITIETFSRSGGSLIEIYNQIVDDLIVEDVIRAVNKMPDIIIRTKIKEEDILKYKDSGLSLREIAKKLGCSHQHVANIIKKYTQ